MNTVSPIVFPGMKLRLTDWNGTVVKFNVHSSSRRISARWRNGEVEVVVPPDTLTRRAVETVLGWKERLDQRKPKVRFHDGQIMEFDGLKIRFGRQSLKPLQVHLTGSVYEPVISVGTGLSFDDDEVISIISRLMTHAATNTAPKILLPIAREEAARVGLSPTSWSISRGHNTLGRCSGRGEIALSSRCVFLPDDLRRYIVCHELAHLVHMNHSADFHRLCNKFLDGNERLLINKLKKFQWPLL